MGKMHLIAVDLDHTALDNLYELNDVTAEALKKLKALGHRVIIATARPSCLTMPHYERLGLDTTAVLCNGADLVNLSGTGPDPQTRYLSTNELDRVLSLFPTSIIDNLGLERDDDLYIYGDMSESPYHMELIKQSNTHDIDIHDIPRMDVGRVFLRIRDIPEATEIIGDLAKTEGISFYYRKVAGKRKQLYISIQSLLANKWFGIAEAAEYYGIARENIITFGDEFNDEMMLEEAGLGFVMKNGNEELKKQVGNITRYTNVEGGVGKELIRLFNL